MTTPAHSLLPSTERERAHYYAKMINTVRDLKLLVFGKDNVDGNQEWRMQHFCNERIYILMFRGVEVRLLFEPLFIREEMDQGTLAPPFERRCFALDLLEVDEKSVSEQTLNHDVARYKKAHEEASTRLHNTLVSFADMMAKYTAVLAVIAAVNKTKRKSPNVREWQLILKQFSDEKGVLNVSTSAESKRSEPGVPGTKHRGSAKERNNAHRPGPVGGLRGKEKPRLRNVPKG